jgi:hypothetical protein
MYGVAVVTCDMIGDKVWGALGTRYERPTTRLLLLRVSGDIIRQNKPAKSMNFEAACFHLSCISADVVQICQARHSSNITTNRSALPLFDPSSRYVPKDLKKTLRQVLSNSKIG